MSTQGLLSIITATYNNSDLLPRFFDSILAQEYSNWELIIVNDGSTDNTAEVCRTYAKEDNRIRYYEQSNQGQSVARNLGLQQAKGELITFVDGDDAVKPLTYSYAIEVLLQNKDCDIVAFPIEWSNSKEVFTSQSKSDKYLKKENMINALYLSADITRFVWDKIYYKSLFDEFAIKFEPGIVFEDNLLVVQLLLRAKGICFSHTLGYEYHQEEYSPTKNQWTSHKEYSQIVVNCMSIDELSGDPSLRDCRAKLYQQIGNQLSFYIKRKEDGENLQLLKKYIRSMPLGDALCNSVLSLKHKGKLLLLKLYAQL